MAYSGKFIPKNISKYKGDPNNITYRSLWERSMMVWLDSNSSVESWGSEEIAIQYDNPVKGRKTRYYPDFYVKFRNGIVKLIEIKPLKETKKPEVPKRKTEKYQAMVETYIVNQEKWKAADIFCKLNNIQFEVWTEVALLNMGILHTVNVQKPKIPELKKESNKSKTIVFKRVTRKS